MVKQLIISNLIVIKTSSKWQQNHSTHIRKSAEMPSKAHPQN